MKFQETVFTIVACLLMITLSMSVSAESEIGNAHGATVDTHNAGSDGQHAKAVVTAKEISLIDKAHLAALDKARHKELHIPAVTLVDEEGGLSALMKLLATLGVLLVAGVLTWKSGVLGNTGVAGRLYTGFAVIVTLAIVTGLGGWYFLNIVTAESHLQTAALDLDMMVGEAGTLQAEFILMGIEDKAKGETILEEHAAIMVEYAEDIAAIRALGLEKVESEAIDRIEGLASKYKGTFDEITGKYHEIQSDKELLDELGAKVSEELTHLIHEHEANLAALERSGASMAAIILQNELVETLMEAEIYELKLAHAEVAFLLNKHIERIPEMEHNLGMLLGYLEVLEELIPKAATDAMAEQKDLALLANVHKELEIYQEHLETIIEDELIVQANYILCDEELGELEAVAAALSDLAGEMANDAKHEANLASIVLIGIAVVLGGLLAFFISRGITMPLNAAVQSLSSGAEQVTSAAGQVAQSSTQMAEGASEQASSLEETAASIEEITAMTRQNTDNSHQAKNLAAQAQSDAETGSEAMGRMSEAINEIKSSADETAGIVKTIEEIAFQTNLLALNAAVEAARAGDAGKGFAVVAEEVRNLAQRAAEAARSTGDLITGSVKNAENGVAISKEVADSLSKIAEGSTKVNSITTEVSSASEEQARGIDQINTGVEQMNQVTQGNAANSEEGAAAAEELSAQAAQMMNVVEDLSSLVGGAQKGKSQRNLSLPSPSTPIDQDQPVAHQRRTEALDSPQQSHAVVNPNQVIPLDDDDMSEF